jgi:anti-sigma regulatory factor (Ser/Thr protein kinase)
VPVPPSQPRPAGGGGWPLLSQFAYGPLPDTVPTARARTKAVLAEWEITSGDLLLGDIAVVISELISNAVTASRALPGLAEIRVWLCCDRRRLLIEVGDHCVDPPLFVPPSDEALSGRGLLVVDKLSSGDWGWFPATPHGLAKVVWAEIRLPHMTAHGRATGQPSLCRSAR